MLPGGGRRFGTVIENVTAVFSDEGFLDGNRTASAAISLEGCRAPKDAPTAALLDQYEARQQEILGSTLGSLAETLDSPLTGEAASSSPGAAEGAITAGCMLDVTQRASSAAAASRRASRALSSPTASASPPTATLAIVNGGAIRSSLPSGAISRGDLIQLALCERARAHAGPRRDHPPHARQLDLEALRPFIGASGGSGRYLQVSSTLRFDWYFASGVPTVSTVAVWEHAAGGAPS